MQWFALESNQYLSQYLLSIKDLITLLEMSNNQQKLE